MSDFTQGFTVTIPAGTSIADALLTQTIMGLADVQEIDVVIPAGCAGNVGFQIWAGLSPAFPNQANQWFVFDDYTFTQPVSNQVTTGQWAINAYNLDTFPHTLRVYFKANYVLNPILTASSPIVSA